MPPDKILPSGALVDLDENCAWAMSENGFMTDLVWEEIIIPNFIKQCNDMRAKRGLEDD